MRLILLKFYVCQLSLQFGGRAPWRISRLLNRIFVEIVTVTNTFRLAHTFYLLYVNRFPSINVAVIMTFKCFRCFNNDEISRYSTVIIEIHPLVKYYFEGSIEISVLRFLWNFSKCQQCFCKSFELYPQV